MPDSLQIFKLVPWHTNTKKSYAHFTQETLKKPFVPLLEERIFPTEPFLPLYEPTGVPLFDLVVRLGLLPSVGVV